jgi:hypothetical protein
MINSILAYMRSDDDFNSIIVMVPLTPDLLQAIKACSDILLTNRELITSVKMGGEIVSSLTFPSKQHESSFRSQLPEEGEAIVVKYALKAYEKLFVALEIDKTQLSLQVVDNEGCSYGYSNPVYIDLQEIK